MKITLRIPKKYIVEAATEIEAYTKAREEIAKEIKKQKLDVNIEEVRLVRFSDVDEDYKRISVAAIVSLIVPRENGLISLSDVHKLVEDNFPNANILKIQKK